MCYDHNLIVAGDLLPSKSNMLLFEAGDTESLFDEKVRALFNSADFSIVNLEGPLTDSEVKQDKVGPVLRSSVLSVNGIKSLGVKCVALANNHFTDYLQRGCEDTLHSLDLAGILHIGGGMNANSINSFISLKIGGTRVCIYNVSETFFNKPDDLRAGVNIYDEYIVCNRIKELKNEHDYLMVIYHGGAELFPYPTPLVRSRFHRMADCGADLITAQHTHCIGCEEYYNNSYLLYGQGNFFLDHMQNPLARKGIVLQLSFDNGLVRIHHHIVSVSCGKVIYDLDQNLESFYTRSNEIADNSLIIRKYEDFIRNNDDLKNKYYQAFKGRSLRLRSIKKVSSKFFYHCIEREYNYEHLSRIVFALESDRMREDVLSLWNQLKESKHH